jgi:hypothetical protein
MTYVETREFTHALIWTHSHIIVAIQCAVGANLQLEPALVR